MIWQDHLPLDIDHKARLGQPFKWHAVRIDELEPKRLAIRAGDLGPWQAINVYIEHVVGTKPTYIVKRPVSKC